MAKLNYENGITSVILRVKILDTDSTAGAGKTGLTHSSSGLIISTIADNEATATAYTQAASNIETITTLGTFAAPTASKCRFKEVDATNHPGLYEVQIADARWGVSNARSVIVSLSGVSGAAQVDAEVQLKAVPANVTAISDGLLTAAKFASDFFTTIWDKATSALTTPGSIGAYVLAYLAAIRSVTDNISGVTFVHSPVDEDGNTRIVKGKRYTGSQKLHYSSDTTRDLSSATIVALEFDGESFPADSITGSVGDWDIYIPLTNAETLTLSPGVHSGELAVYDTSPTPDQEIPELAQFSVTVERNR